MSNDFLGHFADLQRMIRKNREPHMHVESHSKSETHEHRAPTDASVQILRELERAAEDKFIGGIRGTPNKFDFTCFVIRDYATFDRGRLRIKFSLNDQHFDFEVDQDAVGSKTPTDFARAVYEAVSKKIAQEIMMRFFHSDPTFFSSFGFK